MIKNYNPANLHQSQGQEQSKKLYRSISDNVRRLDDSRSCARNVGDLFTPNLQILRSKLRDYCERLIFSNPCLYGRKGEELLWRKGFYEVISTSKRLKKQEYTQQEKCNIQAHINSGIGYYHHYLARLQQEFDYNLTGLIDFPLIIDEELTKGNKKIDESVLEWLKQSLHRTLIYLGDLSRYKLEIYPNWDINLTIRYYSQAIYLQPDIGMPHNQMGTLANTFNLNHSLDAVYHYIRCMMCKNVFEGTENNLHRIFEKNAQFIENLTDDSSESTDEIRIEPSEHIKRFISRFLLLTDIWFFSKKVPHIYHLCHKVNVDLRMCLNYSKPVSSEIGDMETVDTESLTSPAYLNPEILYKMSVVCILCISKLQNNIHQISNVIAFSLALYSQLIRNVVNHIHESVLNLPVPPEKSQKLIRKKKKLRRRRKLKSNSDESENSDYEANNSSSDDDFILEDDAESVPSSDEELEADKSTDKSEVNGIIHQENNNVNGLPNEEELNKTNEDVLKLSRRIDVNDMLEIISEENLLQTIKILSDWLRFDVDVLKSCGKSTRSLFNQIIHLINLINVDWSQSGKLQGIVVDFATLKENIEKIALPEDVILKEMEILKPAQKNIDWNMTRLKSMSLKEDTIIRILKFVEFGHFLVTIPESGVTYDAKTRLFSVSSMEEQPSTSPILIDDVDVPEVDNERKKPDERKEGKGQLSKMKHMGQLWLAEEVRELENRVRGKTALSPYLVIDVECLISHTHLVKQLVFSRKFIVLVPTAVVSALDELKKVRLEAREAIRWLENQFHRGNRFFRAQRPQERLPLPFIKYPKKKDKEATIFIQIIECCHYLAEQQKGAQGLVTLLMGNPSSLSNNTQNKEISYLGLANSAGVNLEVIEEFYTKWKKTFNKAKR